MKNLLMSLIVALSFSSIAEASTTYEAFGDHANNVIRLLEKAGVEPYAEGDDSVVYHLRSIDCYLPKEHKAAVCSLSAGAGENAPTYRLRGSDAIDMLIGLAVSGAMIQVDGTDRRVSVRNLEASSNVHAPASSISFVN